MKHLKRGWGLLFQYILMDRNPYPKCYSKYVKSSIPKDSSLKHKTRVNSRQTGGDPLPLSKIGPGVHAPFSHYTSNLLSINKSGSSAHAPFWHDNSNLLKMSLGSTSSPDSSTHLPFWHCTSNPFCLYCTSYQVTAQGLTVPYCIPTSRVPPSGCGHPVLDTR